MKIKPFRFSACLSCFNVHRFDAMMDAVRERANRTAGEQARTLEDRL
jgi:hypothetical protein